MIKEKKKKAHKENKLNITYVCKNIDYSEHLDLDQHLVLRAIKASLLPIVRLQALQFLPDRMRDQEEINPSSGLSAFLHSSTCTSVCPDPSDLIRTSV